MPIMSTQYNRIIENKYVYCIYQQVKTPPMADEEFSGLLTYELAGYYSLA